MVPSASDSRGGRILFAENHYAVAHMCIGIGHVEHEDVHADVAHGGALHTVYKEADVAAAHVTVNAVGIPDGNGGYYAAAFQHTALPVAYGGAGFPCFQRDYGGAEGGHRT